MKWRTMIAVALLVAVGGFLLQDTGDKCGTWASSGECTVNAGFMLSRCAKSCGHLTDLYEQCEAWARQGECSNNPLFMNLQCASSCQHRYLWSPWLRQELRLGPVPLEPDPWIRPIFQSCGSACLSPQYVPYRESALTAYWWIFDFFQGRPTPLSTDGPNQEFGILGLGEVCLYAYTNTLKLYETKGLTLELMDRVTEDLVPRWRSMVHLVSQRRTDQIQIEMPAHIATLSLFLDQVQPLEMNRIETCPHIPLSYFDVANASSIPTTVRLNNGVDMPLLGFGTWRLPNSADRVVDAIEAGYRHIDTAAAYRNEADIGSAWKRSRVPRHDLFLATKLSSASDLGYAATRRLVQSQLKALQTNVIDLYMLHSPFGRDARTEKLRRESWAALEEYVDEGVIRCLGVSNFDAWDLRQLLKTARIPPSVLQNKHSPYHQGSQMAPKDAENVLDIAREHGIVVVGYSTMSSWPFMMSALHDPHLVFLASKYRSSPAQILLQWQTVQGIGSIPRSTNAARMRSNLASTSVPLHPTDKRRISALGWLLHSGLNHPVAANELHVLE